MNYNNTDDGILIERFQQGQKSAFDELVFKHKGHVTQHAYRLTGNTDEAADVVAETFLRAFKSLDRFKRDSSFATWLYRIETNCFLDIKKRVSSRPCVRLDDMHT